MLAVDIEANVKQQRQHYARRDVVGQRGRRSRAQVWSTASRPADDARDPTLAMQFTGDVPRFGQWVGGRQDAVREEVRAILCKHQTQRGPQAARIEREMGGNG